MKLKVLLDLSRPHLLGSLLARHATSRLVRCERVSQTRNSPTTSAHIWGVQGALCPGLLAKAELSEADLSRQTSRG